MNAAEARSLATQARNDGLHSVFRLIEEAAKNGLTHLKLDRGLTSEESDLLAKRGYRISHVTPPFTCRMSGAMSTPDTTSYIEWSY